MSDVPIRDADDMTERPYCELCGDPMPAGEEMFKFHGYSGPCPTLKSGQQTRPKSSWELRCEQAERERDEARRLRQEEYAIATARLQQALDAATTLARERDEWRASAAGYGSDAEQYKHERDEARQSLASYVGAVKEYFDSIVNHGLACERVRAANDRADHLYSAWKREPTEELSQRRKENLTQCLMAADAASEARHREEMAREALGALLTTTAVGSSGDAALGGEVRGE